MCCIIRQDTYGAARSCGARSLLADYSRSHPPTQVLKDQPGTRLLADIIARIAKLCMQVRSKHGSVSSDSGLVPRWAHANLQEQP